MATKSNKIISLRATRKLERESCKAGLLELGDDIEERMERRRNPGESKSEEEGVKARNIITRMGKRTEKDRLGGDIGGRNRRRQRVG